MEFYTSLANSISKGINETLNNSIDLRTGAKENIKTLLEQKKELLRTFDGENLEEFNNKLSDLTGKINEQQKILDENSGFKAFQKTISNGLAEVSNIYKGNADKQVKLQEQANAGLISKQNEKLANDKKIAKLEEAGFKDEADKIRKANEVLVEDIATAQAQASEAQNAALVMSLSASFATFAQLAVAGKATLGDFVGAALDSLLALIPIFSAEIFGLAAATLGPIAGPIAAAIAIAGLTILSNLAKSKASAKFLTGGESPGGTGLSGLTSSGIKYFSINENSKPEYIVNARSTAKYKDLLDLINKDKDPSKLILDKMFSTATIGVNSDNRGIEDKLDTIAYRLERVEKAQLNSYQRSAVQVEMEPLKVSGRDLQSTMKTAKKRALKGI